VGLSGALSGAHFLAGEKIRGPRGIPVVFGTASAELTATQDRAHAASE